MRHILKLSGVFICLLCSLFSFYFAVTHLNIAGGRSGLVVVGVIFILFAAILAKEYIR